MPELTASDKTIRDEFLFELLFYLAKPEAVTVMYDPTFDGLRAFLKNRAEGIPGPSTDIGPERLLRIIASVREEVANMLDPVAERLSQRGTDYTPYR